MNKSVSINERNVLYSGSIVAMNDEPVTFSLSKNFIIVFKFIHESGHKEKRRNAEVVGNKLVFTFLNYEEQLGVSNSETIELGTLNGSRVFMNYAFYLIGDPAKHARVIHYTFLESLKPTGGVHE